MAPRFSPSVCLLAILTAVSKANDLSSKSKVTPIDKVLQMMDEMVQKGTEEMQKEQVTYAAFKEWCDQRTGVKKKEINTQNIQIDELSADIENHRTKIRKYGKQIDQAKKDQVNSQQDIEDATAIRNKEENDYVDEVKDLEESIDALERAIAVLSKRDKNIVQAELVQSLVQVRALRKVPHAAKAALTSFLQVRQPELQAYDAPEAKGYEFQSGGVLDMLRKLKDEFSEQKHQLQNEELAAQHAFEDLLQTKNDQIEVAKDVQGDAKKAKAKREELKADDESDKHLTISNKNEDEDYLGDVKALCKKKAEEYESRQELRKGELEAIKKAIEIISSKEVKGTGKKKLPSMLQVSKLGKVVLTQRKLVERSPLQSKLASFLAQRAHSLGSRLLMDISQAAAEDPFKTVKKMIKDLEFKLREEAAEEAEHHGFCQAELGKNKLLREDRTADIADIKDNIEDLTNEISQLAQQIADLKAAVSDLDAAMGEAATDRTESKAENLSTIKEAKEAQTAVEAAIAVLKDFYAKSAQATAFAQESRALGSAPPAPATWEKSYKGMLPEGGSVVDFLQVILSDFERLEEETSSAEEEEQSSFEKITFDSKKDKDLKESDIKYKSNKKVDAETSLHAAEKELQMTQDQLDKAIATYDKLKPQCVDSGINYEDRVKQREAEIASLEDALNILAGQDIA